VDTVKINLEWEKALITAMFEGNITTETLWMSLPIIFLPLLRSSLNTAVPSPSQLKAGFTINPEI